MRFDNRFCGKVLFDFLSNYDRTSNAICEIIDMPGRQIDLFIQLCLQNGGRLSAKKRTDHFAFLSDEELAAMERVLAGWPQGE